MKFNPWFWLPFLVGAMLRLAWVWTQPLWYDENFTLAVARLPWSQMWMAIQGDVHPPLYYLLISPLARMDLPSWALRLPSVLLGILSLPLAWRVFGLLASEPARRVAFIVFAVFSTANIFYAQEARMYALLTLLLLAAAWCILRRSWAFLGLVSGLLLYTQDYALLYLPSLWLAGLAWDRRRWLPLTLAIGLAGLAFLPWVPILLRQQANLSTGYWIPPITPGVALIDLYHAIIQKGTFRQDVFGLAVIFGWASYAGWWHLLHRDRSSLFPLLVGFGPWLLAILGSIILGTSIMHYRSLVPCSPFLVLWLSIPLAHEQTFRPHPAPAAAHAAGQ